ncbi:MAG: DUF6488 family protein [bacterium]
MKPLVSIIALSSVLLSAPVLSGTGHDHGHGHNHSHAAPEATQPSTKVDQAQEQSAPTAQETASTQWKDTIDFTVQPAGEMEYKVQIAAGSTFNYAWDADRGKLFFDFHGEPKGDTTGYFKTFNKGTKSASSGMLVTEFEGTHGWYWKNDNAFPVVVSLQMRGDYQRLDVEVTQEVAEQNAMNKVADLIRKGKLEESWASVEVDAAEIKPFNGKNEWLVTFVNPQASDATKQKLFVFLTMNGEYIAANFSGK